jgi:hypothetical protein
MYHTSQVSDGVFCTLGFEGGEGWGARSLQAGGNGAACLRLPLKAWVVIVDGLGADVFVSIRGR